MRRYILLGVHSRLRIQMALKFYFLLSDPLKRGFTEEGKFESDVYRCFYSLYNNINNLEDQYHVIYVPIMAVFTTFILATQTNFFGEKLGNTWSKLWANKNVVFIARLITKHFAIFDDGPYNHHLVRKKICSVDNLLLLLLLLSTLLCLRYGRDLSLKLDLESS